MRLVHVDKLQEGDIVGKDIISEQGGILLRRLTVFKDIYRKQLLERNIHEIYVEDELSNGIEPVDIITPEIRRKITSDVRTEFDKIKKNLTVDSRVVSEISTMILEELAGKNTICEMMDLKINDDNTYEHCISVAIMTALTCKKMCISEMHTKKIVMGALMHDIGKIIIPKDILNKPGALTSEEMNIMKSHAEIGYELVKHNVNISPITKVAILCHHEREDGTGYPLGKTEDLHIGAKIVAACDIFHALMSDRPYRQGFPLNKVILIAKSEKVNPEIRQVVESILAFYPVGTMLVLSSGEVGFVEKNFVNDVTRPLVKVVYNIKDKQNKNHRLDLQIEKNIQIVRKISQLEDCMDIVI
ncbi:MAG: HD-GYP domain-containing protein [Cellulosilyticaceae bacterium]